MGYFPVRYDSRVVNYDHRGFIRLATGLVVMGGDSRSEGPGAVYWMDMFSHIFVVKICNVCFKRPKINENGPFKKRTFKIRPMWSH